MANFILYSNTTSVTGKNLKASLKLKGSTQAPEGKVNHLIRWGSSAKVAKKPTNVINKRTAVALAQEKRQSLVVLHENHVSVPRMFSKEEAVKVHVADFPLLGRKTSHTQGTDIVLCMQGSDVKRAIKKGLVDFFTAYVPTAHEFRVHVFNNEVLKISEKVLTEEDQFTMPWIRNLANGFTFRNVKGLKEDDILLKKVKEEAIRAVQILGLDFGAADVIVSDNGQPFVLEVNTGPSLSDNSLDVYVQKFAEILGIQVDPAAGEAPEIDAAELDNDF